MSNRTPKPALFASLPDSELLACGVPPEWIPEVRKADEDTLLVLAQHLPAEAAEALLDLATGSKPKFLPTVVPGGDPFAHPDAQRRFRVMRNVEELERALDYPGTNGPFFSTPANANWSSANLAAPPEWQARPAPAKRLLRCTGR